MQPVRNPPNWCQHESDGAPLHGPSSPAGASPSLCDNPGCSSLHFQQSPAQSSTDPSVSPAVKSYFWKTTGENVNHNVQINTDDNKLNRGRVSEVYEAPMKHESFPYSPNRRCPFYCPCATWTSVSVWNFEAIIRAIPDSISDWETGSEWLSFTWHMTKTKSRAFPPMSGAWRFHS